MSDTKNKSADIRHHLWEALDQSPFAVELENDSHGAIPMHVVVDRDSDESVWFYTSRGNRRAGGGAASMQFSSKGHDLFACVKGKLVEEKDPSIIDKHWSNPVEAWYEDGRSDSDLLMMRFELENSEIWEADPGAVGAFKLMTGMTVKPGDVGAHTKVGM